MDRRQRAFGPRGTVVDTSRGTALRRRARRGAIMVEALVVIPFFLIIFAGVAFIGDLYSRKQATHRDSMAAAWEAAMQGCRHRGPPLPGSENIDLKEAAAAPGTQLCADGFGEVTKDGNASATASKLLGAVKIDASTSTTVTCDENPVKGDFDGATRFLWAIFEDPDLKARW